MPHNFDSAQAIGLGQHLHKLDRTRTPTQHLRHVLVTCNVHFKRNIAARYFNPEIRELFWLIPTLRTKEGVIETFSKLRAFKLKDIDNLLKFYQIPWVLSSLSPAYTNVPLEVFNNLDRTTNAGESAHANANRMGKGNSLVAAIYKRKAFDKRRWAMADAAANYNARSSNNSSIIKRVQRSMKRTEDRAKKKESKPILAPSKRLSAKKDDKPKPDISFEQKKALLEMELRLEEMKQKTIEMELKRKAGEEARNGENEIGIKRMSKGKETQ